MTGCCLEGIWWFAIGAGIGAYNSENLKPCMHKTGTQAHAKATPGELNIYPLFKKGVVKMTQADKNVEDDAIVNLGPKENVDQAIVTMGPKENVLKHSLQTAWTVWHYNNDRSQDWDKNLREVVSFDTIEDFWAVINHIQKPSGLKHGCDYMLFRKGIKPMWEDKANMYGGRWLFGIDDKRYTDRNGRIEKLDIAWLEVMMCLIGEAFGESGNHVNGAVCQRRKMKSNKLALWLSTSNVSDESSIIYPIGTVVKQRCASDLPLVFEDHYASASRKGPQAAHRLEIK